MRVDGGRFETTTGFGDRTWRPLPSWPLIPFPQQTADPSFFTAHACSVPAEIEIASERPWTPTGVGLPFSVPFPSWPALFAPQHATRPPPRMAQEKFPPAATAAPLMLATSTGVEDVLPVCPLPSCPSKLKPQ